MKLTLRPRGLCQFILNDSRPYIWCDEPALPGKPWCKTHHERCHITVRSLYAAKLEREAAVAESIAEAA